MADLVVVALRGSQVESEHRVSVAVTDTGGGVVARAGDAGFTTFWRSAAKPFQLFPLVADGGVEKFELDDSLLALACASHNAESVHREVAARWLSRIGATEADMACGGHPSLWPPLADAMAHDEVQPSPIWSNCSGKHAAMLAQARLHGWGWSGYQALSHPVQQRIADAIASWTGTPREALIWGVDGCDAPAVALPLVGMSRAYTSLGTSVDPALSRIRSAMIAEPYLLAGAERLETVLMQAWPGRVIAKIGAGGVYSAVLTELGLGVALKVHDGDMQAATVALMAVLEEIIARVAPSQSWPLETLSSWRSPAIRNTRSVATGVVECRGGLRWT